VLVRYSYFRDYGNVPKRSSRASGLGKGGLDLHPGDDFEIVLEDDGSIILRRVSKPPNAGLIDHLLNAPGDLEIPERARDFAAPPNFEE